MLLGVLNFKPFSRISSVSCLDQHSNIMGYFGDFSRICMKSSKDHARIIAGSNCNYVRILKAGYRDLERISVR